MRQYSNVISLNKNSRGVYILDTSMGCKSGMENEVGGCYGDCYAAKSAKIYGYDFSKTVLRYFKDEKHRRSIVRRINKIELDFVRIGGSGDPAENWDHTVSILKGIDKCNKQIVVITRHWTLLTQEQLEYFATINICVNSSVSALDKPDILNTCVEQYDRLKMYCKSVLRIISCDFNLNNPIGHRLAIIQKGLFENESTLDTVLRVNKNNQLVEDGVINIQEAKFLGQKALVSKLNKSAYFGKCSTCYEQCGLNINPNVQLYPEKRGISKQLRLFKLSPI